MASALGALDIADVWTGVTAVLADPMISGVVVALIALGLGFRILRKVRGVAK